MSFIQKNGKNSAWMKQVLRNIVSDIILYESLETNMPIARRATKLIAKLIGWSKKDTLCYRRLALKYLVNKKHQGVMEKLFSNLKDRYKDRNGGYTRIIKSKFRKGDNSSRVLLSLV